MSQCIETPDATSGFRVTGRFVLAVFVGFFLVVGGVNALMVRYAVSTFGGVETESAYKAGLQFRAAQDAADAQAALGWTVAVHVERRDGQALVEVAVRDRAGRPVSLLAGRTVLQRPADRRRDIVVDLAEAAAGTYRGAAPAEAGVWDAALALERGEARFRSRNRIVLP